MTKHTLDEMSAHIERLAKEHGIKVIHHHLVKRCDQSFATRKRDDWGDAIGIMPIRSAIGYATALHELGHILGQHQDNDIDDMLTQERWAWEWARQNALVWTPTMERCAVRSLAACALHGC
jgi:hypothetical protein